MKPETRDYIQRGLERTEQTRIVAHSDGDISAVWPAPDGSWVELYIDAENVKAEIRETPHDPVTIGDAVRGQTALELILAMCAGAFIDTTDSKGTVSRVLRTVMDTGRAKGTPDELRHQRGRAAVKYLAMLVETYAEVERKKKARQ